METFSRENEKTNFVYYFAKGLILSLFVTLALIVIFAFLIKWLSLNDGAIFAGTIVIKAVAVLFGSIVAVKNSKGLFKGICFGLIYVFVSYVLFSILSGSFSFDKQTFLDFVSLSLVGGLVGIIKVNK